MEIRDRIIAVVVDLGWDGDVAALTDDLDLIESGVIDSLRLITFVNLLEERFGVTVDDRELHAENFETIRAVQELLVAKLG